MPRGRTRADAAEGTAPGPERSLEFYEACVGRLVLQVLEHGRALVGLGPLPPGDALTDERVEAEADAAEAFVRARVAQTGLGFLTMALGEDEWLVMVDSHQRPHREPPPLGSAYDRFKATAHVAVQAVVPEAAPATGQIGPADERVVDAGAKRRRPRRVANVGRTARA